MNLLKMDYGLDLDYDFNPSGPTAHRGKSYSHSHPNPTGMGICIWISIWGLLSVCPVSIKSCVYYVGNTFSIDLIMVE